jgi:hypothetical protein
MLIKASVVNRFTRFCAKMADPRLTYAKPTRRLHLRQRSGPPHLA